MMNIHIFEDTSSLNLAASTHITDLIHQKPDAVLGLATGVSPLGIYQVLIHDHQQHQTSYKHVSTYNLDEYIGLAPNHPQSYRFFMQEHFFKHINIDAAHTYIPNGEANDHEAECKRYNAQLSKVKVDIQLLGIGSNGHIGFNEPGTPFDLETHVIALDDKTRRDNARFFRDLDDVPTHAITMGIANIMRANTIVLVAMGPKKAPAVQAMINGPVDERCPASVLQQHPDVHIYLDHHAASLLT